MWSWIETIVIRPSTGIGAGVVGDDQRAALGGDVLDAADLDPEPLLGDRPQRGHEEPLGDLLVEAVLVDDVVAGHPAAQERQEPGQLRLPLVAEELLGGVLERGQPVARPGCPRSGPRSSVRLVAARTAVAVATSRTGRLVRGRGSAPRSARSAAFAALGAHRPAWPAASSGRPSCAGAGEAARTADEGLARRRAAAGAATGADRDDLGVTHRLPPEVSCRAGVEGSELGQRRRAPARCGHRSASARWRSPRTPPRWSTTARSRARRASGWCRRPGRR